MVQAASLFNQPLQHFPRSEFAALIRKHSAEGAPRVLAAGRSWSRCCSANLPTPTRRARSATVLAVAWANWCISASAKRPINPLSPTVHPVNVNYTESRT